MLLERETNRVGAGADQEQLDEVVAVDVLMIAYNMELFIAQAIEGVLAQQAEFPVRLVIAEDHSNDDTCEICTAYASRYPDRITFIPGRENRGISGRTADGVMLCRAKYLAICDSDDIWTDPSKLQAQVGFLEANQDHGLSYSDVELMSRSGETLNGDTVHSIRADYASGEVFLRLLRGNFINNSTVVLRRALLDDHDMAVDRDYYIMDYLVHLHVAARSKIHFLPKRTARYRSGGISSTQQNTQGNKKKLRAVMGKLLVAYGRRVTTRNSSDRALVFRRSFRALTRRSSAWPVKWGLLGLMAKHGPRSLDDLRHLVHYKEHKSASRAKTISRT